MNPGSCKATVLRNPAANGAVSLASGSTISSFFNSTPTFTLPPWSAPGASVTSGTTGIYTPPRSSGGSRETAPTAPPTSSPSSSTLASPGSISPGAAAGAGVGGVLGLVVIAAGVFLLRKRQKKKKKEKIPVEETVSAPPMEYETDPGEYGNSPQYPGEPDGGQVPGELEGEQFLAELPGGHDH